MKYYVIELNDKYWAGAVGKWEELDLNKTVIFRDTDEAFLTRSKIYASKYAKDDDDILIRELKASIGNIILQKYFLVTVGKYYFTTTNEWDQNKALAKLFAGTMTVSEILREVLKHGNPDGDIKIVECKA